MIPTDLLHFIFVFIDWFFTLVFYDYVKYLHGPCQIYRTSLVSIPDYFTLFLPMDHVQLFFSFDENEIFITNYHKLIVSKTAQICFLQSCRLGVSQGSHSGKLKSVSKAVCISGGSMGKSISFLFATRMAFRGHPCSLPISHYPLPSKLQYCISLTILH